MIHRVIQEQGSEELLIVTLRKRLHRIVPSGAQNVETL